MKIIRDYIILVFIVLMIGFSSCQKAGVNNPGSEYMPDMYHPISYQANYSTYYSRHQWVSEEEYLRYASPRIPVKNTIPRDNGISDTEPFYYGDTPEERIRAMNEIVSSPFEFEESDVARGKELYDINCAICHGENGNGRGYLVRENGGMYPAMPANLISDDLKNSSDGRYYYAIMKGINIMGPFNDVLNHKERWMVINHIRTLQR